MSFGQGDKQKRKKGGNLNENKVEKSNKCDTCDYAMPTHDPDDPGTTPPADNPPTDDDAGLSAGAIVGIVVGSVLVDLLLFGLLLKRKLEQNLLQALRRNKLN